MSLPTMNASNIKLIHHLLYSWNNSTKVVAVFWLLLKHVSNHFRHKGSIIPMAVDNTYVHQTRNVIDIVLV